MTPMRMGFTSGRGLVFLLVSFATRGQDATVTPEFDAASIKPAKPGDMRGSTFNFTSGGGLAVTNGTLKDLVESAYDVRDFQIIGGAGWVDSDRYDVTAKSAHGDPGTTTGITETRQRLQALLSQRFMLRVHRETRELPVYALVVGRNGSKLVSAENPTTHDGARRGIQRECGRMTGTSASIADLTVALSRQLGRPVVDRTGFTGRYDFQVSWMPDSGPCAVPAGGEGAGAVASSDGPSLFTALQEQLGLKLESTKGPVEVIVIDSAEKASEN